MTERPLDAFYNPPVPAAVGALDLHVRVTVAPNGQRVYQTSYRGTILDTDGEEIQVRTGRWTDHMTAPQKVGLKSLADDAMDKLESVIPSQE